MFIEAVFCESKTIGTEASSSNADHVAFDSNDGQMGTKMN